VSDDLQHTGSEVIHAKITVVLQRDHFKISDSSTGTLLTFLSVLSDGSQLDPKERESLQRDFESYYPSERVLKAFIDGIAGKDSRL
jgi:fructose/tagatose bisphosphate aldolase